MQPSRYPQPLAVKIAGCVILAYALGAVWMPIALLTGNESGWPDPVLLSCAMLLPPLLAICGSFILKGANWARILFFAGCIPLHLILVALKGVSFLFVGILPAVLLSSVLTSAASNRFFTGRISFFKAQEHDALVAQRERGGKYEY